ncbi:MAG: type II toxin-antitoxin system RelB/DinJ family antitoxin [Oscillospiraceae bacterium]|jgi:DNA-damage-inducible protein J|nr:type II toxin-antitoxin system RelB/DinJ family antitoxin [Oscillospiraceae bacterium]
MIQTTNLNIRIEKALKEQAEELFAEMGMSISTAFNVFVRQSLRLRKIPFEISVADDPFYSPSNMAHLRASIAEAEAGHFIVKTMEELKAMEDAP